MDYIKILKYKYQTKKDFAILTGILGVSFSHEFFKLNTNGLLIIFKGYKWDGVSGPTWDSKNTMAPGCVHDALYQAIRLNLLPLHLKDQIDILFYKLLLAKGMCVPRAWYYHRAVYIFGASSCIPGDTSIPEVLKA